MSTTVTPSKLIGTAVVALIVGALLAPTALARPDTWTPQPELGSLQYGPDAFERAVIAQQTTLGDYRDAGHAVTRTSGAMLYPDAVERSTHLLRLDPQTSSPSSSDGGFDWTLFTMLLALGGIAVLGAAAVVGLRQRTRLA
jgi:hypothetical protein